VNPSLVFSGCDASWGCFEHMMHIMRTHIEVDDELMAKAMQVGSN
jgi:hypothetical protein